MEASLGRRDVAGVEVRLLRSSEEEERGGGVGKRERETTESGLEQMDALSLALSALRKGERSEVDLDSSNGGRRVDDVADGFDGEEKEKDIKDAAKEGSSQ
jgi:predicted DNA-binding protein